MSELAISAAHLSNLTCAFSSNTQGNFFDEFQIEGVSAEYNEIYLELTPENFSRSLKTSQNAKAVKIKLTMKHCPCITIAVELVRSLKICNASSLHLMV